ncbi:MAG: hypothetical protein QOE70_4914 [Chthoniobacter sp.]|jgi:hypothetical protein|nr:hypothetical protein [Chthoniobacter sp.]
MNTTHIRDLSGRIITFYSYKGGVGRSMALANIAVLLARLGKRVLVVDWDLEAPGLDRYFAPYLRRTATRSQGLLGLLETTSEDSPAVVYRSALCDVCCTDTPAFHILPSGDDAPDYGRRVANFSWVEFFSQRHGGRWLNLLRQQWKADYDFVLLDSRTGFTDGSGVCTIQLPDQLVLVLAANQQNLEGCARIIEGVHKARGALPYDLPRLAILPILSRFDGRHEVELSREWLQRCADAFQPFFDDWLHRNYTGLQLLERTKLPHIAHYSFGEKLTVLRDSVTDPDQLPYYYSAIAKLISEGFETAPTLLTARISKAENEYGEGQGYRKESAESPRKARRKPSVTITIIVSFAALAVCSALIVWHEHDSAAITNGNVTRVPGQNLQDQIAEINGILKTFRDREIESRTESKKLQDLLRASEQVEKERAADVERLMQQLGRPVEVTSDPAETTRLRLDLVARQDELKRASQENADLKRKLGESEERVELMSLATKAAQGTKLQPTTPSPASAVPQPRASPPPLPGSDAVIHDFLKSHIKTENTRDSKDQRDYDAIVAGYAGTVDYGKEGKVPLKYIRVDKEAYFTQWPRGSEGIEGEITVKRVSANEWEAVFQTRFERINDKAQRTGTTVNSYRLRAINGELKIVSQKWDVHPDNN